MVGFTITESLNHVLETKLVGNLREELEKRKDEIESRKGTGIFLVQIYPETGPWTHDTAYHQVIAFEVEAFGSIPNDMIKHILPSGRYIKIVHKGAESRIGATYDYINKTIGFRPVDIEYWDDIHQLETEHSRIDIYIPASQDRTVQA